MSKGISRVNARNVPFSFLSLDEQTQVSFVAKKADAVRIIHVFCRRA